VSENRCGQEYLDIREVVTGEWRKLHNKGFIYTTKIIKSRKMKWWGAYIKLLQHIQETKPAD
jgi:hypothetical protein